MHVGVVLFVDMANRVCQRTPWWRMWRMPRQQVLELWVGEVRHGWWGEVAYLPGCPMGQGMANHISTFFSTHHFPLRGGFSMGW